MIPYVLLILFTFASAKYLSCPNASGYFPVENSSCKAYFKCEKWMRVAEFTCPEEQNFVPNEQWCDWEDHYPCIEVCWRKNGLFPKFGSKCKVFYKCTNGMPVEGKCPGDQLFSYKSQRCEPPGKYSCEEGSTSSEIPVTTSTQSLKTGESSIILVSHDDTTEKETSAENIRKSTSVELTSEFGVTSSVIDTPSTLTASRIDSTNQGTSSDSLTSTDLGSVSAQTTPQVTPSKFSTSLDVGRTISIPKSKYTGDPDDFVCPTATGLFPHPTNKEKFIQCNNYIPHVMNCPSGLVYNPAQQRCLWP